MDVLMNLVDVLIVPVSVALLALLWPLLASRRRRRNFEDLIRRELEEAAPVQLRDGDAEWHQHMSRRFLHEEIIGKPADNADFVLSLEPELSYHLSQVWISYGKAKDAELTGKAALARQHSDQFCWHLGEVAAHLDRRQRRSDKRRNSAPLAEIHDAWVKQFKQDFPDPASKPNLIPTDR